MADPGQAKSLLAHFEDLTAQLRVDIAAFGRGGLSAAAEPAEADPATWQSAAAAVHRVSGVLAFVGDNDDPLAHELRALHAAVSPRDRRPQLRSSVDDHTCSANSNGHGDEGAVAKEQSSRPTHAATGRGCDGESQADDMLAENLSGSRPCG